MASLSLTRPICSMGKKKKEMKRKKKRFFKFFLQLGNQSHNMANNKQIHNRIDWDLLKSIMDSLRIVQINCEFVNNLPIIDRERERECVVFWREIYVKIHLVQCLVVMVKTERYTWNPSSDSYKLQREDDVQFSRGICRDFPLLCGSSSRAGW